MIKLKTYLSRNIAALASIIFVQGRGCDNPDDKLSIEKTKPQSGIILPQNNLEIKTTPNSNDYTSEKPDNLTKETVLKPNSIEKVDNSEQKITIIKSSSDTKNPPIVNQTLSKPNELLVPKSEFNEQVDKSNEATPITNATSLKENDKTYQINKELPRIICIGQHESRKTMLFNTLAEKSISINDPYFKLDICGRFSRRNKASSSSRTTQVFSTTIDCTGGKFELVDTPNISTFYFANCIEDKSLESMECNILLFNLDFPTDARTEDKLMKDFTDDLYIQDYYRKSDSNPFETLYFDYRDKFVLLIHYPDRIQRRIEKFKNNLLKIVKDRGYDDSKVIFMPDKMDKELIASEIYEIANRISKSEVNFKYGKEGKPKEIIDAENMCGMGSLSQNNTKKLDNIKNRKQIMEDAHKMYAERVEQTRVELRKKAGITLSPMPDHEEDETVNGDC